MLLTAKEVATRIGYATNYLLNKLQYDPKFPRPVRVTPNARPRWREEDLQEWLDSLRVHHAR